MENVDNETTYNVVSWQDIQGNKYSKSIHPAMLSSNGYRKMQKAALLGKPRLNVEYVLINYDREYVINYLIVKIIRPISNIGYKDIISLISEAWNQYTRRQSASELSSISDE